MGCVFNFGEGIGGITVAAWSSVMGSNFECGSCKRPASFLCPKRDHLEDAEIMQMIADSPLPKSVPMIFKAEAVNICPKFLLTPFAIYTAKIYSWWEKGNLGVDLLSAPSWIDDAFRILESERAKARDFSYQQKRRSK